MWFVVIYSIDRKWNWDRLLAVSMAMASAGTVQLIYWAFDTHLCTAFVKLWSGSLHDTNQESWRRNCCWYIMKWPPQWISNAIFSTLPVHWRRWLWFAMSPKNYIRESILFFNDRFELWNQIFETIYWESEDSVRKSGVRPFDVSHTFLRLCRESLSVHKLLYFEIFLWLESTKEKQFSCFIFRWHRISTAPPPNYHPTYTSPEHTNSLWFDPIR